MMKYCIIEQLPCAFTVLPESRVNKGLIKKSAMFTWTIFELYRVNTVNDNNQNECHSLVLYDFLGTAKAAPHECVIRTGQP